MTMTRLVNGKRITLSAQEEADQIAEWEANQAEQDAEQATKEALDTQIESEKTALPTRVQVKTAIDNVSTLDELKVIVKKIAMPVYTYLKNSVD